MEAPVIIKETDYSKFTLISWNRELSPQNMDKLEVENKKEFKMQYFPILVDANLNVIDGQHRFSVCKNNNWPVYYIIKPSTGYFYEEIRSVNTAGKRHSLLDMFEMVRKKGNKDANLVYESFLASPSNISLNTFVRSLGGKGDSSGGLNKALSCGEFRYDENWLDISKMLEIAIVSKNSDYQSHGFIMAIKELSKKHKIQPSKLASKVINNGLILTRGMSRPTIKEAIAKSWNYKKKNGRIF